MPFSGFCHFRTIFAWLVVHRRLVVAALIITVSSGLLMFATKNRAQRAQKPPMFVLQVGIGKYLDAPKWTDLRGAVTDVVEMRKVLESDRFRVPAANILTLKDEQGTKQKIFASYRDHLIANAKNYFEKTRKRDAVVLFQYSGHGSQAPDADGDETKDKLDETLVTYDSQDVKGKNFDVTDDEIFALTSQLRRYTDNIVYVFDSCHSGSGTRNAEDARRLPARTTVPEPVTMPGLLTRSSPQMPVDNSDGVLPPGEDYIVISAAESEQLATQKYCFEECGSDKEPVVYGLLSYYLIDELKNSRNDTSYRELMDNVTRKVRAERPSQTPVIEGDERRAVFGNLGKAEDNFVPIVGIDTDSIRIRAGAIQGVAIGTVVYVYDKSETRFEEAEKIGSGRVTRVSPTESTVKLEKPRRPVTPEDKAVTASSDLASTRLKVFLGDVESKTTAPTESVAAKLRTAFQPRDARGVDVIPNSAAGQQTGRWNVVLLKDKYSKVFPEAVRGGTHAPKCSGSPSATEPSPERDIYYVAGPDYVPLFGFCVEVPLDGGSVDHAASKIERALTHISRYRSIQSVQNRRSRLAGKFIVKPIRLTTRSGRITGVDNCIDGKLTVDKYEAVVQTGSDKFPLRRGEVFWFEVTNNSPFDVYVAMLNLKSDGSIALEFPRNIDGEKQGVLVPGRGGKRIVVGDMCRLNDARQIIQSGAFITPSTASTDTFKFIATTSPVGYNELSYLEMDAIRNETASIATSNEWITVDLTFEISD